MNTVERYFALLSNTNNACTLEREFRTEARRTWMCPGCTSVKPHMKAIDVWIQERRPADKPMNFTFGGSIPLIHRELLGLIDDDTVARDLYVGRVYGESGNEVHDWVTVRGRKRVLLRGSSDIKHRICPDCGQLLYSALGAPYLYPEPSDDAAIFESNLCGLVVRQEVAQRVAAVKWRRMSIEPLPILDPPPDGLGILPGHPGT